MNYPVFGSEKGVFGAYWMGTVNGHLICTDMHRTPKAAAACARRWFRHQQKCIEFGAKPHRFLEIFKTDGE